MLCSCAQPSVCSVPSTLFIYHSSSAKQLKIIIGRLAEWSNAASLKLVVSYDTESSNLSSSALLNKHYHATTFIYFCYALLVTCYYVPATSCASQQTTRTLTLCISSLALVLLRNKEQEFQALICNYYIYLLKQL